MQKKSFARASCIFLTVICSIASYSAALSVLQLIPVLSSLKATPKTQSLAFLFSLKHYISLLCRVYIFIYSLYTDSSFLTPNCLVYAYNYFDAVDQISPPCLYIHPSSLSYLFPVDNNTNTKTKAVCTTVQHQAIFPIISWTGHTFRSVSVSIHSTMCLPRLNFTLN
jgi:hypothetical protein